MKNVYYVIFQGVNSHFALSLEKNGQPYLDFAPLPSEVFVESSVLIRVQNSSALNYETSPTITFQVTVLVCNDSFFKFICLIKSLVLAAISLMWFPIC